MPFGLDNDYVTFDGQEFAAQRETNTNRYYHEDRIEVKGMDYRLWSYSER